MHTDESVPPSPASPADFKPETLVQATRGTAVATRILATIAVLFTVYFTRPVLVPLAAAFLLTVSLRPVAQRLVALHIPRPVAAIGLLTGGLRDRGRTDDLAACNRATTGRSLAGVR